MVQRGGRDGREDQGVERADRRPQDRPVDEQGPVDGDERRPPDDGAGEEGEPRSRVPLRVVGTALRVEDGVARHQSGRWVRPSLASARIRRSAAVAWLAS